MCGIVLAAALLAVVEVDAANAQSTNRPSAVAEAVWPDSTSVVGALILPISIHGDTVGVILDVGTTVNILSVAELRKLNAWLPVDSVRIGTSVRRDVSFERLEGRYAPGVVGLIGAPSLSQFDLVFDGPHKIVRLYPQHRAATPGTPLWFPADVDRADCVTMAADSVGAHRVFFPLRVNGRSIHSMFDSGSMTTNINVAAARVLGLTPTDSNVKLLPPGVGGQFSRFQGQRIWRDSSVTLTVGRNRIVTPINIYEDLPRETSPDDPELSLGLDAVRDRVLYVSYSAHVVCLGSPTRDAQSSSAAQVTAPSRQPVK